MCYCVFPFYHRSILFLNGFITATHLHLTIPYRIRFWLEMKRDLSSRPDIRNNNNVRPLEFSQSLRGCIHRNRLRRPCEFHTLCRISIFKSDGWNTHAVFNNRLIIVLNIILIYTQEFNV